MINQSHDLKYPHNSLQPRAGARNVSDCPVFQWEPVNGATSYIVEIDSTPEFQNPVSTVTFASEFQWSQEPLKLNTK